MARKSKDKTKEEKVVERDERQRTLLEKLGFAQMVFDFYMAPVE
jgi:G:T-mismatch repair DNA endonuclease (very short patch repair protein)